MLIPLCAVRHAGEQDMYCQALVEAHKACLRSEGFKVRAERGSASTQGALAPEKT